MKDKYVKIMERMIVAFFMTQIVSFTITIINYGFITEFLLLWARSHMIALAVGEPTCLLITPLIEKLSSKISVNLNKQRSV